MNWDDFRRLHPSDMLLNTKTNTLKSKHEVITEFSKLYPLKDTGNVVTMTIINKVEMARRKSYVQDWNPVK